jgi:hypothetical protein
MATNIQSFLTSFKKELARPARFDVFITIPPVLAAMYGTVTNQLSLRCEMSELPGRTFNITERKFGSAPVQKVPFQSVYNDVTMTFIVSGDMTERLVFDQWMELINPSSTYNFKYKTNYVTDIAIRQYDLQNNITYSSVLIDAFPLSVGQMDLDWTSENYHRLPITFAYTNWQEGTVNANLKNLGSQAITGLLGI